MNSETVKVPVTVLTGFLGAGKTTLLNRILSENHGQRIAVIENEFGEIGVDNDLVIQADEEIFEMNNGCICCTVRGDLIRILGNLIKRRDRFDHILIETTGLADPGPVAQTFFMEEELGKQLRLDGIVTLVDALHVVQHLDESAECQQQIAFADAIILNKQDLVNPEELDGLEKRIRQMNGQAKVIRSANAAVPIEEILHLGGFDLDRAIDINPDFMQPEFPFEWSGRLELPAEGCDLVFEAGPDPSIDIVALRLENPSPETFAAREREAMLLFSENPREIREGENLRLGPELQRLHLSENGGRFPLGVDAPGEVVLFAQHLPQEFNLRFLAAGEEILSSQPVEYAAGHSHDDTVSSVGIREPGLLDEDRFNNWIGRLLQERGPDLFRMKGILNLRGRDERAIFQGVHMIFDARLDRPWGNESRENRLIFIGRNLNRNELTAGFHSCLAPD